MKKLSCLIPIAVFCMSCTPRPTYEMSDVEYQLMKSALSVEDSLRTLAATQEVYAKAAINTDILTTPQGGMGGLASLDWSGPIEPLLERIGEMSRYRVKVLGPIPPIPLIVTISCRERMLADILKDAGLQAGRRANLVVYPTSRIIELRYAAIEGPLGRMAVAEAVPVSGLCVASEACVAGEAG